MNRIQNILIRIVAVVALAITAAVLSAPDARAAGVSTSLEYSASVEDRRVLIDTGVVYLDGCIFGGDPRYCFPDLFPGTVWFRIQAGVKSTSVVTQAADLAVEAPGSLQKGSSAEIKSALAAKDGAAKEVRASTTPFLVVDVAYDKIGADCARDRIKDAAELDAAQVGDCIDAVVHSGDLALPYTFNLLEADTLLPYSGSQTVSSTRSTPALDIGALLGLPPGILSGRIDFVTGVTMSATNGYMADRTVLAGGSPIASGPIQWPSADVITDAVAVPAGAPKGAAVEYRLANNRWEGHGKVTGTVKLVLDLIDPIPDLPAIPLVSATLFDQPIVARASDVAAPLGRVGESDDEAEEPKKDDLSCSKVRAVPRVLDPVNGTLRLVNLKTVQKGVAIDITGVRQDERVSGKGDIGPDAKNARHKHQVYLRAQRLAKGDGRVYTVRFKASRKGDGSCTGSVRVSVPRHEGKAAVLSKPSFDSFKR